MKKRTKITLGIFITVVIISISILALVFYTMTIEDHYGDLQETFYESKDGDIIVGENEKVGFIEKTLTTIRVFSNNSSEDLYNWLNQEQSQIKYSVYRPLNSVKKLNNISLKEIENLIKNKQIEFIISN